MTKDFIAKRNNRQQNTRREQLSPQEWAEKKQLEKESVYQLIDSTAEEISENPDKLKAFLDVQARMDKYSSANALLIYSQLPEATRLKDFAGWGEDNVRVKKTYIFIDEIYLLFQHEYSANFLFTLWKRVRKYGAVATGITQNVEDLLQSHTARTMLANSEFIVMLNQASTDRDELAHLLNISELQLSYITNSEAGHGLIKVGSALVPFANKFPTDTKLYRLMTTKPGESSVA